MKTNHTVESSQQRTNQIRFWFIILMGMTLVLFGASIPAVFAEDDDIEIPFDEAIIYFELNNTDGDLGIHALIDGEPWKTSTILSSDVTEFQVPTEILSLAVYEEGEAEVKFEVLVRATNANQTAVESCFKIVEELEED